MANKKINQLVSKTAILSTDIFGIGDATTGQLFKKTIAELQAAIGGAVISVNGLVGTVVLDTDDIQELATPTNKYFTDARARGAISLTVTGNSGASTYSSGTGVLNVPTYTLAGLGGITASFLSGTSGISYNSTTGVITYSGTVYTDASIRALLSGSTGITYNSSTGAISYSGTVYTDSSVRALISMTTTGTSGASTYNNTTGVINVPNYTLAGLGGISLTSLSGGTGITYNNTTGAISYSGTVYTDASVRALISATSPISYNNTTGVISLTSGNLTEATSSVLTITGGTGAVIGGGTSIQVKQATTSVSGFLSSTDWTTFNNKQGTITLNTTGTSGAATFSANTLNIPQYAAALSGTANYVAKFTSTTAIGNSQIFDNGTNVGIGTSSPTEKLSVVANSGANGFIFVGGGSGTTLGGIKLGNGTSVYGTLYFDNSSNHVYLLQQYVSGDLIFGTNSVEKMRITSGGDLQLTSGVAIFTRSGKKIELNPNSGLANIDAEIEITSGMNLFFKLGGSERMRITSGGNVEIKSAGQLIAYRSDNARSGSFFCDNVAVQLTSSTDPLRISSADRLELYTVGAERMRITSGGNILIGTTSDNGERLFVSGSIRATGSITANSDLTLKKNLLKIKNALEKVEQINGYTYEFKEDDSKRHGGVIAQEIDKVFPEIVNTGNDGLMGVEYGNISALLIEAIKEQNTKIKNLETLLASK